MTSFILLIIATLFIGGALTTFFISFWGVVSILIGGLMLFGIKNIPAKPPTIGLVTVWGERIEEVKSEGLTLLAPYFPFYYDIIPIVIEKRNKDFPFENVRCKFELSDEDTQDKIRSGGSVKVVASITWKPNNAPNELIKFINSGGDSGVTEILADKMAEEIRQMGRENTWEEMVFATQLMSANLIISIVGHNIKTGEKAWKENFEQYTDSLGKYILPSKLPDDPNKKKLIMEKVFDFLHKAMSNGISDDHDLGIKILRLNIKSVEPEGDLKREAENSAKEAQQRRAEDFELQTELRQASILKEAYKKLNEEKTLEQCVLEIRRRKLIKDGKGTIIDLAGFSPELITAIAELLRGKK